MLGAEGSQRAKLIRRPDGAAGIVRAAQEDDFGSRRQLAAQRIEIHRVAPLGLDKLRIENAPLVGDNDLAKGVIGGRKDDDLVAGRADGLKDEAEPDTMPGVGLTQLGFTRKPWRRAIQSTSAAAQLPVSA